MTTRARAGIDKPLVVALLLVVLLGLYNLSLAGQQRRVVARAGAADGGAGWAAARWAPAASSRATVRFSTRDPLGGMGWGAGRRGGRPAGPAR